MADRIEAPEGPSDCRDRVVRAPSTGSDASVDMRRAQKSMGDYVMRHALAASRTGTWRWLAGTGEVRWDETMEALSGLDPGSFGSTFDAWLETLHPEERDDIIVLVEEALRRGGGYDFEHRVVWPDGTVRWLECRGEVTVDNAGVVTGTVGCAIDVTLRKVAEVERESLLDGSQQLSDRLARLHQISLRLAAARDVAEIGQILVDLVETPNTAASRGLWLVDQKSAALELIASVGFVEETAVAFGRIPLDSDLPGAESYRKRGCVVSVSADEAIERYPGLAGMARSAVGFAAVPLTVGDTCLGVVGVGFDGGELPELDLSFLEAASGHFAQTVARVRLSDAVAKRAHEAAMVAEREWRRRLQLEFLGRLTIEAITASDHAELMRTVTAAAVPQLGDWCSIVFIPEPGAQAEVADAHADPERVAWAAQMRERFPFDPERQEGVAAAIRNATTQFIRRVDDHTFDSAIARSPDHAEARQILEALQLTSMIAVPLVTQRGVVGAIQFVTAESGHEYDDDDVALAEAAAGRIAAALDVLWFSDQHRYTASTLQTALLPPQLPTISGIEVSTKYFPAGTTNEVGGDFYDLFAIGQQKWAFLIGDVCGNGPHAAAVTSIARHTVRAAARHGHDHRAVLEWVNDAVLQSDRKLFCTAIYGTIDAWSGKWRVRLSAAGHPLPVLRRASGPTCTLGKPGTLLGVLPKITTTPVEVFLEPGDVLLLYTDGMTDLPPPYGILPDDVVALVANIEPITTADNFTDAVHKCITARVADTARSDDIALLAFRAETPPT